MVVVDVLMDGTVEAYITAAETHAKYGTTSIVPTTYKH